MSTIDVNGITLFYDEQKPEKSDKKEILLFLHGLGGCSETWCYQQPFFCSRGYTTITVDLRGHGKSSKPHTPYSIALFAQDIAEFIKKKKLNKVILIGHSLGGITVLQIALLYPELVSKIILINSFSALPLKTIKMRLSYLLRVSVITLFGLKTWTKILAKNLLPKPGQSELRDKFKTLANYNTHKKTYFNSMKALLSCNLTSQLSIISCPCLMISADDDYTPSNQKYEDAYKMKNAHVVIIPDSRHLTLWDQPEQLNSVIATFLKNSDAYAIVSKSSSILSFKAGKTH